MQIIGWLILIVVFVSLTLGSWKERQRKKNGAFATMNTTVGALLRRDPGVAQVLIDHGMHCVGCPSSAGETVAQAAAVHQIDAQALLRDVNRYFMTHKKEA